MFRALLPARVPAERREKMKVFSQAWRARLGGGSDDRQAHPAGFDASRRRQDSPPLAGVSVHDGTSSDALRQFVRGSLPLGSTRVGMGLYGRDAMAVTPGD